MPRKVGWLLKHALRFGPQAITTVPEDYQLYPRGPSHASRRLLAKWKNANGDPWNKQVCTISWQNHLTVRIINHKTGFQTFRAHTSRLWLNEILRKLCEQGSKTDAGSERQPWEYRTLGSWLWIPLGAQMYLYSLHPVVLWNHGKYYLFLNHLRSIKIETCSCIVQQ
jgi:hypothetical protein